MTEPFIRPYRTTDRDDVADICVRTAAAGGDATGIYSDDLLMPEVYALPYLEHSPDLAWVVEHEGRATGYILGVADTAAFADWWAREWTPGFVTRHPAPGPSTGADPGYTEAQLLRDGADPQRMVRGLRHGELTTHPAHLHIDLLPVLQRRGLGSRLIDTLRTALADRGVPGVHLGYAAENTAARAFYDRYGFEELPSSTPTSPLLGITTR
ncbi:GNAT family N-acetyltransferase [Promicromonospora thailandica]|uniref:GNAT family N-acetyltransferase n=1 Tax=Promicromonospora thailandica TaxID=765201 RepID=UPI0027E39FDA|nr:GNAT family N-acetyltransferase [Promicromonospora thailandica]